MSYLLQMMPNKHYVNNPYKEAYFTAIVMKIYKN